MSGERNKPIRDKRPINQNQPTHRYLRFVKQITRTDITISNTMLIAPAKKQRCDIKRIKYRQIRGTNNLPMYLRKIKRHWRLCRQRNSFVSR